MRKHFRRQSGELVPAIDGISLDIREGEFCVLLGPSGCGKTTLLRCIAGLEEPDSGRIEVGDLEIYSSVAKKSVATQRRGVGMVFQNYALWPHLDVKKNVAFPLTTGARTERLSSKQIDQRVRRVLATMGLEAVAEQPISALSGGQQQRVSLARAIASGAKTILFDEPLSNVDAKVREHLRYEIRSMQQELGFTALYVTHDQEEAMDLADRIVVLKDGKIEQQGTPTEVYDLPSTRFVADFIGRGVVLDGKVTSRSASEVTVDTSVGTVHVRQEDLPESDDVAVVVRAQNWVIHDTEPKDVKNAWNAEVLSSNYFGSYTQHIVDVNGEKILITNSTDSTRHFGRVWISVAANRCRVVQP